ncbi:MAG: magnesium chelatase subunit D [Myxococcota bacterium]|nr:magnesium chelatase subunit D [Myxococcota bacterium]
MTRAVEPRPTPWDDASMAAALFAVDPPGTGGVVLRSSPGPVRDRWLAGLQELLPAATRLRRLPLHVADDRLLGGLDLAATLRAGRPIAERGILVECDGSVAVLAMAERLSASTAARLGLVLDTGEVRLERDGVTGSLPTRFGVVALDEGIGDDEQPPATLRDRLAFGIDLAGVPVGEAAGRVASRLAVSTARRRLADVRVETAIVEALCAAALSLGIGSIRAPQLALRVARAAAALAERDDVDASDARLAARLVLGPRASALPAPEPAAPEPEPAGSEATGPQPPGSAGANGENTSDRPEPQALEDSVLAAAEAAIPAGLLERLRLGDGPRSPARSASGCGGRRRTRRRGRPIGVERGDPRSGARLDLVATLRAAAPWQRLRGGARSTAGTSRPPLRVHPDDVRVKRFEQRSETAAIFVVDASGSTAVQRLAEAKGAVEMLLAECYVRRERVALIAFRDRDAQLLLAPTRSLVRAKRQLAGLPGGGATPLAAGIAGAQELAESVLRREVTPLVILLTDGRANVARDGTPGRTRAEAEAIDAARQLRRARIAALVVDTSPRPRPAAERIAAEMGAPYLPLPHASSSALCDAVRGAAASHSLAGSG